MRSLTELKEIRQRLDRYIERETPLAPAIQSPSDPGWELAYITRKGKLITIYVFEPSNLDRHKAMLAHDCDLGKARHGIDLSDAEWDQLLLASVPAA